MEDEYEILPGEEEDVVRKPKRVYSDFYADCNKKTIRGFDTIIKAIEKKRPIHKIRIYFLHVKDALCIADFLKLLENCETLTTLYINMDFWSTELSRAFWILLFKNKSITTVKIEIKDKKVPTRFLELMIPKCIKNESEEKLAPRIHLTVEVLYINQVKTSYIPALCRFIRENTTVLSVSTNIKAEFPSEQSDLDWACQSSPTNLILINKRLC